MQETRVWSLGCENALEKEMATHSRILAWEIHGQRSLAGYSPWGRKESDTTEWVNHNKYWSQLLCRTPAPRTYSSYKWVCTLWPIRPPPQPLVTTTSSLINVISWFSTPTIPSSYCSWVLKAGILKSFATPFSSGPHFVRTLHHHPSILGGHTQHGSEFNWVIQGCGPCDLFD